MSLPLEERPLGPLLVLGAGVMGCIALVVIDPTAPRAPLCPSKALFGFNCPICGSTRMLYYVLHLDIAKALAMNAYGLVVLVLAAWAWLYWLAKTFALRIPTWTSQRWVWWLLAGGFVVWFILRLVVPELQV
ncbi:DUF2752 domain-containing protein [Corynebacterium sp. ES2794-CONJ1]|uniref:DUF2752 domain-containing protein n=1 Tax=unclassified Corynebacterium TaxID=2624378 RepID=UPI002168F41E|nr:MULTISPECIES: DUF2752 domain-containing protein [unclassified Corynebacterium]MCS4490485.1 DUF2752 domain-containing protein [Corynebacterium sp. ES2775-CONJ]MCU9519784.1 DUF2752 domain-containing protein [Corynebacterium sp. ES2794-CONJ1]